MEESKMKRLRLIAMCAVLGVALMTIGGCAAARSNHRSSSVVQYLYPEGRAQADAPQVPRLTLPVKVGIAFVPDTLTAPRSLTEKDKSDLQATVAAHFKQYDFVKTIEIIPSAYLTPKGGFANLEQVRSMFDVDVVALVSYDQTQFTDEGLASITYWTVIGAYIVPGEKNDTHTMVDAAVYDIASRKLLFRAPGVSHIRSKATPVNLSEQLRTDSLAGFTEASNALIKNLDDQLAQFQERVKASPQDFQVVKGAGYTGKGSLDVVLACLVLGVGGLRLWTRDKTSK
jgi:rhombotail lipoprotein